MIRLIGPQHRRDGPAPVLAVFSWPSLQALIDDIGVEEFEKTTLPEIKDGRIVLIEGGSQVFPVPTEVVVKKWGLERRLDLG